MSACWHAHTLTVVAPYWGGAPPRTRDAHLGQNAGFPHQQYTHIYICNIRLMSSNPGFRIWEVWDLKIRDFLYCVWKGGGGCTSIKPFHPIDRIYVSGYTQGSIYPPPLNMWMCPPPLECSSCNCVCSVCRSVCCSVLQCQRVCCSVCCKREQKDP